MPRASSIAVPLAAYLAVGFVAPAVAFGWLSSRHEPPYVVDGSRMESVRSAVGGAPVSVHRVTGVLELVGDGGSTATFADGGSVSVVHAARPSQVIEKYGGSLAERTMTSFSVGGFTERDATLGDGGVTRTFGIGDRVFAFTAPNGPSLERLIAQSAVRRNTKRDIGNAVFDDHGAAALVAGVAWFALATIAAGAAIARAFR